MAKVAPARRRLWIWAVTPALLAVAAAVISVTLRRPAPTMAGEAQEPAARPGMRPLSDQTMSLTPGLASEANFRMKQGERVRARFAATGGPVMWDSHAHVGDRVIVYRNGTGAEGEVEIVAPHDGLFSFLFAHGGNATQPILVKVYVEGESRWEGWDFGDHSQILKAKP